MKLNKITCHGIGVFRNTISVPFDKLGSAKMIAVRGENGSGKTTLLELIPGAMFRSLPSRGPLSSLAQDRDSFLEVGFDINGLDTLCRVQVNGTAHNKPTEAYLLREDPLTGNMEPANDGKAKTYDQCISDTFPSMSTYLASAFGAAGGSGRFLSMSVAERKDLFAQILGLERLEQISSAAKEHVRSTELNLASLKAGHKQFADKANQVGNIRHELDLANSTLRDAKHRLLEAEKNLEDARSEHEKWLKTNSALERSADLARSSMRESRVGLMAASDKYKDTESRLVEAKKKRDLLNDKLNKSDELENIVRGLEKARTDLAVAENDERRIRHDYESAIEYISEWNQARAHAEAAYKDAKTTWDNNKRDAGNQLKRARERYAEAKKSASALGSVPCDGKTGSAICPLVKSAIEAKDSLGKLASDVSDAEIAAVNLDVMPKAVADAIDAGKALPPEPQKPNRDPLSWLESRCTELRDSIKLIEKAQSELGVMDEVRKQISDLESEIALHESCLASHEIEITELNAVVDSRELAVKLVTDKIEAHASNAPPEANPRLVDSIRQEVVESVTIVARAEERLAVSLDCKSKTKDISEQITTETKNLDEWNHLAHAFGPRGIQALEIDAAGPAISALCNDLLSSCYGYRFSASLETTALRVNGKSSKETFDLVVIDTERGTHGSASKLSTGEQVLIGEALGLALTIYAGQRSGCRILDLIRDECAGALSQENGRRYIAMLRRAVDLGGFARCWYVAQQPELWALADAELEIADGEVRYVA